MIPVTSSILNAAGEAYKSNAATTMMTTGLGFVRAGMVPLDKKTSDEKKAQVAAWCIASTLLSLATQLTVYKGLNGIVDKIGLKNFGLNQWSKQYLALKKLPLDQIDKALKAVEAGNSTATHWIAVKNSLKKAFDLTNPKEAALLKKLNANLDDLARGLSKTATSTHVEKEVVKTIVENVKMLKGNNQLFMFLFGAALFTGFMIPAFTCKYLPNMMQWSHDHLKIKGKPIVPEPKKPKKDKKQLSNVKTFGLPLVAAGGILAFLRAHTLDITKGVRIKNK